MKFPGPTTFQQTFIGLLSLSLFAMPLLGLHIHLPETHLGTELHSHHAEAHRFHIHTNPHENIDTEAEHPSDAQQIDLDTDTRLVQVFKILAFVALTFILMASFISSRSITLLNYVPPFLNPFEIYRTLLRGPPLV